MPRTNYVKAARKEHRCDVCRRTIEVGQPYKHMSPRLPGSYGSRKLIRCSTCPGWQPWDYSNSLSARIQQIQYDGNNDVTAADEDSIADVPTGVAEQIRELAEEKREAYGFGHSTYQSDELDEWADNLDSWADAVEGALDAHSDIPVLEDYEDEDQFAADLEDWLDVARNLILDAIDGSPF